MCTATSSKTWRRPTTTCPPPPDRQAGWLPLAWTIGKRSKTLAALQRAVLTDRRLRLRYRHGRDQRIRTYTLDPYGLVNKAGVWYLVADRDGEAHLFRADRARSAAVLAEPVQRRDGLGLAEVWETLRRGIDDVPASLAVTVRVRAAILALFRRVHAGDLADAAADTPRPAADWTRVELRFRSLYAAETLLAFGPDVEVLSPAELRRTLARKAAATAALYAPRPDI